MSARACVLAASAAVLLVLLSLAFARTRARAGEVRIAVTGELRARLRRCGCQGPKGPTAQREEKLGVCCGAHQFAGTIMLPDMGGIPERSAWLAQKRAQGDVLSLDTGDLFFPSFDPLPHERPEWKRRAELLVEAYGILGVRAWVPGELDLALGRSTLLELLSRSNMKTLAANLRDAKTHEAVFARDAIFETAGARVGVVGALAPPASEAWSELLAREGLEVVDPVPAVRAAVSALRSQGADLVVLLAHQPEDGAREIVRAVPGIDLVFAAHSEVETHARSIIEEGAAVACPIPGGKAPVFATVRLVPGASGVDVSEAFMETHDWLEKLEGQEKRELEERSRAQDDAARKEADAKLAWTRSQIEKTRGKLPQGVRHEAHIRAEILDARALKEGQDQALLRAIDRYKQDVEAIALDPALVAALEAPAAREGGRTSAYLTAASCTSCHEKQANVWKGSKHAGAWASLELAGNQKDPECVRCHAIGFREPGGFAEVRRAVRPSDKGELDFRNVQCEACHGPRLGHPREGGIGVDIPTLETCRRCHDSERDPSFDRKRMDAAIASGRVCTRN